ncbi:MAG: DUF922 domain-containing protein [Pseudomonadota bacterium]
MKALALISAALLLTACTTSQVSTGYYDLEGSTGDELDRQIRLKGPAQGHALASAAIRFKPVDISFREDDNGCRVSQARLQVIANITLPRWQNRLGSEPGLRAAFNNLQRYARAHERTHVRIAELSARDMERSLKALSPSRTCKALDKRVERTVKAKLREHDRAQKAFDAAEAKRLAAIFNAAEPRRRRSGTS